MLRKQKKDIRIVYEKTLSINTIGNQQGSFEQKNPQRPVQRDVAKAKWGNLSSDVGGEDMVYSPNKYRETEGIKDRYRF